MSGLDRRKRVLFVHDDNPSDPLSTFLADDIAALEQRFEIEVLSLHGYKRLHLDALARPEVWRAVARCDLVFAWFGYNAAPVMIASALRKPSIVIAGGADVVWVPEIKYGLDPRKRANVQLVQTCYRLASAIRLFSESSHRDLLRLMPSVAHKAQTLYLGIDSARYVPAGAPKQPCVLSISYITPSALKRKGILTLLEAARLTPEIAYRIAGLVVDEGAVRNLVQNAPPNVSFLGYLEPDRLLAELQAAKCYAQLSHHEGFGAAVAEAMACGCIPVVTDRGSLPEVVGDTGLYTPVENPAAAAQAFRRAIADDDARGMIARQRVVERFQPAERARALHRLVEELAR